MIKIAEVGQRFIRVFPPRSGQYGSGNSKITNSKTK